jgi:thermitase
MKTNSLRRILLFYLVAFFGLYSLSMAQNQRNRNGNPRIENTILFMKFHADSAPVIGRDSKGFATTGIAAVDSLNVKYGCVKIQKMYRGKTAKVDFNADKSYEFKFKQGIDVAKARDEYMATGQFAEILFNEYLPMRGGGTRYAPTDPRCSSQWGLNNDSVTIGNQFPLASVRMGADINMQAAWDCEKGDTSIIAAIMDTGAKTDHPELSGRLWTNWNDIPGDSIDNDSNGYVDDINGWDFRHDDNSLEDVDPDGHGTGIAGIVGAMEGNGLGGTGVDLNCRLMVLKFTDVISASPTLAQVSGAIRYAADNGASVINFSYNFSAFSQIVFDAIYYAKQNGVVFVGITGNDNMYANNLYPAAFPDSLNVLVVGSTDPDDVRSYNFVVRHDGSNYTDYIDVVAPGNYMFVLDNVTDTVFYYVGGTSASAAHVTGLVTLLKAQNPSLSADSIISIIKGTADDQVGDPLEDTPGFDIYHGHGRINAERALCGSNSIPNPSGLQASVKVQPNPTSGRVIATVEGVRVKTAAALVYNIQGQQVAVLGFSSGQEIAIDLPAPDGLYLVKLVINDRIEEFVKVLRME